MTDKVIRVNVTSSKSQKVTVSSSKVANEITASPDTSAYYSRLAKNWAIAEGLVENIDYSSKHYAQESKASADMAKTYEISTQENYNMFMESSFNANSELQTNRDGALADIEGAKTSAIDSLNSIKDENISTIESKANEEIENLNKEIEQGKDEIKDTIDGIKVLTTLEIGDIGIAPLGIDETKGKRRYLNGQVIIQEQYVQFTNKVKSAVALYPSLACTESEWQTTATMTVGGQVGKFVVDDDAGTIRLPKIIMPIQGLTDLSKLGEIVKAGLPNITGSVGPYAIRRQETGGFSSKGALSATIATTNTVLDTTPTVEGSRMITLNASKSNSIYGNSNTVQQEQIQYPYFIQVATGAEVEDNIINEIELNNPYSFGDSKYSPVALNNLSWLKSEGQWNSKAVYPSYYDWALINVNNGVEGFIGNTMYMWGSANGGYMCQTLTPKVGSPIWGYDSKTKVGYVTKVYDTGELDFTDNKNNVSYTKIGRYSPSDESSNAYITDYDVVINPADETFRLPLLDGSESLPSDNAQFVNVTATEFTMPYNGYLYLVVEMKSDNNCNLLVDGIEKWHFQTSSAYFHNGGSTTFIRKGQSIKLKGTYFYKRYEKAQGNGSLYFYVGETVQNANLINAGRIEEVVSQIKADKLDKSAVKAYIVESYVNGASWYRIWSDGWCEQGGYTKAGTTINLLKPYANTNYSVAIGVCSASNDTQPTEPKIAIKSTAQFKFNQAYNNQTTYNASSYEWRLAGFIA